jgi:hypothetical protein
VNSLLRRSGNQLLRVTLLVAIIAVSGVGLGLAAGFPVSRIEFDESDAIRLDQTRLAGEVDPQESLVAQADLPLTWSPGDPAVGGFGILGLGFCGEQVDLPTALSAREVAVFTNPDDRAYLISEAVRVDRWQSAREYVDDVADSVEQCDEFFRSDAGGRVKVSIQPGLGSPRITDHVARTFVAEDGSSIQVWSVMAVGDVIIALQHIGPQRPQQGFLDDLEQKILVRVDPADFAPAGLDAVTPTGPAGDGLDGTDPTVPAGGAADETEAIPDQGVEEPVPD